MGTRYICLWVTTILMSCQTPTQAQMEGIYIGDIDGASITLTLKKVTATSYEGSMQDEQQNYVVTAQVDDNCLHGNAVENDLHITLLLSGCLQKNQIEMGFDFSNLGVTEIKKVLFIKQTSATSSNTNQPKKNAGTDRDQALVGVWKQEQLYSSGSGDAFFGGSVTQKVVFYPDGSIADGGSQATMSGSDYSGNSTSGYVGKAAGVSWSTKNKHLYITITQNNQTQTADAGKYYVENGKMLITDQNGNKTLLIKVQ
ncbi:hypothetical protein FIA58_002330 [Flavobacterium jejuense]|uniref:Lipocalin-like domain-containing protein n=1 Tax=Flavobacterium jejuense TaxID=1544455 RepID=A0ABX0ILP3_9FLAO|nr:hypothetical protein [Flavobacterium jejuense]NHN24501.1 hypothetical protein [Flavobacterium jejuense]